MPHYKDLTQEQLDWLLAHPQLTSLLSRLLAECPGEKQYFRSVRQIHDDSINRG